MGVAEYAGIVGSAFDLAQTSIGEYSETMMDYVMSPRKGEVMEGPDLTGHSGTPGRGAFLILFLKLHDDRITTAKYHTYGCGPTIAAGSMLTELIVGRTLGGVPGADHGRPDRGAGRRAAG